MNKCDFCDLGKRCDEKYYSMTVENHCRKATIKMKEFLKELAEKGATIYFN